MTTELQYTVSSLLTHIFGMFKEPGFGWLSVGDGLLSSERL